MNRHLAHLRRRLRVIAAVLAVIAALLVIGHVREHSGGPVVVSRNADDVLAGYPTAILFGFAAGTVWIRSRSYLRPRKRRSR